jgi:hypothetical protein
MNEDLWLIIWSRAFGVAVQHSVDHLGVEETRFVGPKNLWPCLDKPDVIKHESERFGPGNRYFAIVRRREVTGEFADPKVRPMKALALCHTALEYRNVFCNRIWSMVLVIFGTNAGASWPGGNAWYSRRRPLGDRRG